MTKEYYLSQLGILSGRITFHSEQLYRLRREKDAVSSRWGESTGTVAFDAPYARLLEKIEALEETLDSELETRSRLQRQMEETIAGLPDEKMRLVLLYRYLEGKTFFEIGNLLYMDKSSAVRIHARAMELLVLPEDPLNIAA